MEAGEGRFTFKETRLNLEPSSSTYSVSVLVPSPFTNSRGSSRKTDNDDSKNVDEEQLFTQRHLSTAASIFHREWHDSPRSFLWRILEDGMVLSVRVVDVARQQRSADAPLILNFRFAAPIQPTCVALADPKDQDLLCIYVLDQQGCLYTFSLRPDLFRRRASINASVNDVFRVYVPTALSGRHAHRLMAVDASQLLITLHDGGLLRLDRNRTHDSSSRPWIEASYNSHTWGQGLRSLISIRGGNFIKYGKINMEPSAATSIAVSKLGTDDTSFVFTVCLDHRLRVWNPQSGQILHTVDLLNVEREPHDAGKWMIDPAQNNLVRVVDLSQGRALCATYSPIGAGEFKFWRVTALSESNVAVDDAFPEFKFTPHPPSLSDAWTLADFTTWTPEPGVVQLWFLWKNNTTYRVQRLVSDFIALETSWESDWDAVYHDTAIPTAQTSGPCDPTDATEKWLDAILYPGRFTRATVDTALSIYERGLRDKGETTRKSHRSLPESICSVIASTATLERSSSGDMDYEQFRSASEIQWRRFYRLLVELDKQRGEALSLVLDESSNMSWIVCADLLSAVRECSALELVYHNLSRPEPHKKDHATLISTALNFVDVFPDNIAQVCNSVLRPELFEDSSKTVLERIQNFSDKAGFWRGISDEDCAPVVDNLGDKFNLATLSLYEDIFKLVACDPNNPNIQYPLTDFGKRVSVKAVQDIAELQWRVFFSQLILLVHMEFEFDQEEDALHHRLDMNEVFPRLIDILRRLDLVRWLATTEISVPARLEKPGGSGSPVSSRRGADEMQTITTLEVSVMHLLGLSDLRNEPLAHSLTTITADLCAQDSAVELPTPHIQCFLLKQDRPDLARQLAPFSDQNPFSIYVEGRVSLALKDLSTAAILFKKAAIGLSLRDAQMDRHSVGLLDESEWSMMNKGLAKYYSHIVSLFERSRAYSYVIEFSKLALLFPQVDGDSDEQIRTEMLSRQFNAAIAISHFETAHSTLLAMTNTPMQHSGLRKLVERMCDSSHSIELVKLPFPGLTVALDDILAQKCKATRDVTHGTPFHHILYSLRIHRNDYRGAASILLDRIQKLKLAGEGDKALGEDMLDTPVTRQYLLLINALSCVDPKQAWILSEPPNADESTTAVQSKTEKRKVVTLADIRKEYQDELDRIAAIQNNQFGFDADDDMDIL